MSTTAHTPEAVIAEIVDPSGTTERVTVPAIGDPDWLEDAADHLRAAVVCARKARDLAQGTPRGRQAALVATKAEEALLWALFGDRVE